MLIAVTIWLAISIIIWLFARPKIEVLGTVASVSLWAIAFGLCAAVDFDWWGTMDPLGWLNAMFAGPTEWILGKV